jgi:hypothetical protein
MTDRDLSDVRLVGTGVFVVGTILLLLTILTAFLMLLSTPIQVNNKLFQGLLTIMIAIIMAVTQIGCGGAMRTFRPGNTSDLENLRLVWTALALMMLVCGIGSLWLLPPLTDVAALVLLGLFAVRGAVIRLTGR